MPAPYLNTQEAAFAVLGLGKIAHRHANLHGKRFGSSGWKVLGTFDGQDLTLTEGLYPKRSPLNGKAAETFYWFAETEGMNAAGTYTEEDGGCVSGVLTSTVKPASHLIPPE